MIKGVHTMFYSSEADKLRYFLSDVIGFKANDSATTTALLPTSWYPAIFTCNYAGESMESKHRQVMALFL